MNRSEWSAPTDPETAARRAAGRSKYNAARAALRDERRKQVADLLCRYGMLWPGALSKIARELGVNKSTISRDLQALLEVALPCLRCGSRTPWPKRRGARRTAYYLPEELPEESL